MPSVMFHDGNRRLQDQFDSRRISDRLEEKLTRTAFTADDKAFIESAIYFFMSTADAEGRPDCSFKGGSPGFVRVTARADNHLVLGIAAVGAGVSELSSAFGLALEMGARLEDIGGTIHAHPTLGEAFHEASLRALGEALHI